MAEPPKRTRKSAVMVSSESNDDDIELGDVDGGRPSIGSRLKKKSMIISEEEINALRTQDEPKAQAPIRALRIAVGICVLLTIIIVPSAYAGARAMQDDPVTVSPTENLNPSAAPKGMMTSLSPDITNPPDAQQTSEKQQADMVTQSKAPSNLMTSAAGMSSAPMSSGAAGTSAKATTEMTPTQAATTTSAERRTTPP